MNKVLIPLPIHKNGLNILEENKVSYKVLDSDTEVNIINNIHDCEAMIIRTTNITKTIIDNAPNLKIIARHGVGLDNIDVEYALSKGIKVTNSPLSNINSVAEHTVGLILSLLHFIKQGDKEIRIGNFDARNKLIGHELKEKTLGIIGLGKIGNLVAKKCHFGFDSKVIGFDPYANNVPDFIKQVKSIDELLSQADIVSLHIPFQEDMNHLINKERISLMKKSSILINTARGKLIDEDALYDALICNDIFGAGLDCFEVEPTYENKLFELDNVVLTPHMAAHSEESMIKMAETPAKEVIKVLMDEESKYEVN